MNNILHIPERTFSSNSSYAILGEPKIPIPTYNEISTLLDLLQELFENTFDGLLIDTEKKNIKPRNIYL